MSENGHGKKNGLHWTQTDKGKAKMALVQRKAWRTRRKNAKLKTARAEARQKVKGKKKAAKSHGNGSPDRVSPLGLFDIKTAPKKFTATERKLWERGLLRQGALARLNDLRLEERELRRYLN